MVNRDARNDVYAAEARVCVLQKRTRVPFHLEYSVPLKLVAFDPARFEVLRPQTNAIQALCNRRAILRCFTQLLCETCVVDQTDKHERTCTTTADKPSASAVPVCGVAAGGTCINSRHVK